VNQGLVKSNTIYGIDMLDSGTLDDATVVLPHTGNCPSLSTNAFRMVLVAGSCHVGLGSGGSNDLCLSPAPSVTLHSPENNSITVGPVAVGQWVGVSISGATNQRKFNSLNRRQQNRLKRTWASREGYQALRKRLPIILKLYVSGSVPVGHVKQTILLPTNFHVGMRVSNNIKMKISNESSTTSVSCVSNKTADDMFTQDGETNETIYAADKPTTDGSTNKFTTNKPTQPCYIQQNVWHKQMGTHIANL